MRTRPIVPTLMLTGVLLAGCAPRERTVEATAAAPPAGPIVVPATAEDVLAHAREGRAAATIVHVWATWCVPCREEFPTLLQTVAAHRQEGVRLVLVSADFDDQSGAVSMFLREHAFADTSYLKDQADQAFIDGLDRRWSGALPATLVLNRDGAVVAFWEGAGERDRWEQAIRDALGSGHPS